MTPVIEAGRLRLVPVTYDAAAALLRGDRSAVPCAPGYPHADTADALGPYVAGGDPGGDGGWFVVLRETGEVIGDCGWRGGPDERGDVEIGYGLAAPYRGLGLGADAVRGLLGWVVAQPGVRRVVAEVLADNAPSRRLLERLGFAVERSEPPHVHYAYRAIPGARHGPGRVSAAGGEATG